MAENEQNSGVAGTSGVATPAVQIVPASSSAEDVATAKAADEVLKVLLMQAPTIHDILARPFLYEAWLKKAQEALNG